MAKTKKRKTLSNESRPQTVSKSSKPTAPQKKETIRPTIPFAVEDRILLVGEGDFSFARSIVEHHGCYDVTATCLDSQEELYRKYDPQAKTNIDYLEDEGQTVFYTVNATLLDKDKQLKKAERFEKIIFNFPHVGGKSTDVNRQVRFNQELLVKFFSSAAPLLTATGAIVVTLFESEPYTLWNVKDLARHSNLIVQRSFAFVAEAYPGYSHARTLGNIDGGGGWKGEERRARSYIFQRKPAEDVVKTNSSTKKRKKGVDSDSDDD